MKLVICKIIETEKQREIVLKKTITNFDFLGFSKFL